MGEWDVLTSDSGEEAARQAEERLSRLERRIEELLASAEAGVGGKGVGGEMGEVMEELRGLEGGVKGEGEGEGKS